MVHQVAEPDYVIGCAEEDRKGAASDIIDPGDGVKISVERLMHHIPERIAEQGAGEERQEPENISWEQNEGHKNKLIDIEEQDCRNEQRVQSDING
jgi:hypothetical protein